MRRLPNLRLLAVLATLLAGAAPAIAQAPAPAPAGQTSAAPDALRPLVAMPLQQAQALIDQGKHNEAYAKLDEAKALPGLTPFEQMWIERTRANAAQAAGDMPLVLKALEAALATGKYPEADVVRTIEAMVGVAARAKDNAAIVRYSERYLAAGGGNDNVRLARIQALAETGDMKGAIGEMQKRVAAAESAGGKAPEQELRYLGSLQRRAQDAGAAQTLERLASQYPRSEYWAEVVSAAARRANDNDRVLIELYRLLRATGNLTSANTREFHADLALKLGQPGEALTILEEGFAAGVLGSGERAADHRRLREAAQRAARADAADRRAAETAARSAADGNVLVDLGVASLMALPTAAPPAADAAAALALIEQGVAKGKLRRPVAAQLQVGVAQLTAGRKGDAAATLKTLAASAAGDPLAEAVRLWALWAAAPPMLPPRQ